jgi:hypothetical protein
MRVKLLETFAGSAFEKDNVVELRELAIENLDALFDRFDMRAKARLGILNADKVDVVWERVPSVVGKVPKVGSALKPLIRLLPNPGKRMELLLVEQYVIMVAASYGFDALSVDEGHIRRAILGNKSPLGVRFHTSLRTRTASLNTVARSTDEFNIDSVLERIDDLYRERFLLHRKGD